ncbi:hypothetical protein NXT00_09315 [Corynebacterium sp. ES2715-CONJ3]|nr:hypothetical protein [Corynebacterium sp. ES2715-CONJ3]
MKLENGSADQSLRDMYQYKKRLPCSDTGPAPISEEGQRIRTLLYTCLRDNLPRLEKVASPVGAITVVPSTRTDRERNPNALVDALESALDRLADAPPLQRLLASVEKNSGASRRLDPNRFKVLQPSLVRDRHILLVEDTWVSGASAQSAAVALHRAGASHVTILCIARLLQQSWAPARYLTSKYDKLPPPSRKYPVFGEQASGRA